MTRAQRRAALERRGFRSAVTGCLIWMGTSSGGYGRMTLAGKRLAVHRVMFELAHRRLRPGEVVAHSCDEPSCFEPEHLYARTQRENVAECLQRGRSSAAVLTLRQVREIISLSGKESAQNAAAKFGVSGRQISRIWAKKCWRHAHPAP